MELTWMGRYRELVRALIFYSNCSTRSQKIGMGKVCSGITLTKHEYQVLEYIVEFENENRIQSDISRDVGIQPCTVTKVTKNLLAQDLIERYRNKGNKKSIILKPTELGKQVYTAYYARDIQNLFLPFFDVLSDFSDEEIEKIRAALTVLSGKWVSYGDMLEKVT